MTKPEFVLPIRQLKKRGSPTRENLLMKFRAKDTQFCVPRSTLKAMAKELDTSETQVIHMALVKFAAAVLPAYAPDDGPLMEKQLAVIRKDAARFLPIDRILHRQPLLT